jgi:hypothetical protein
MSSTEANKREPMPVVSLTLPRCPRCRKALSLKVTKTIESSDDFRFQYAQCRDCGCRFQQIWD